MTPDRDDPERARAREVRPGVRSHVFVVTCQLGLFTLPLGVGVKLYQENEFAGSRVAAVVGIAFAAGVLGWLVRITITRDWRWRWGISWPIRGRGISRPTDDRVGGEELLGCSFVLALFSTLLLAVVLGGVELLMSGTWPDSWEPRSVLFWSFFAALALRGVWSSLRRLPERKPYAEAFE